MTTRSKENYGHNLKIEDINTNLKTNLFLTAT